jgi:hypothetical protein
VGRIRLSLFVFDSSSAFKDELVDVNWFLMQGTKEKEATGWQQLINSPTSTGAQTARFMLSNLKGMVNNNGRSPLCL